MKLLKFIWNHKGPGHPRKTVNSTKLLNYVNTAVGICKWCHLDCLHLFFKLFFNIFFHQLIGHTYILLLFFKKLVIQYMWNQRYETETQTDRCIPTYIKTNLSSSAYSPLSTVARLGQTKARSQDLSPHLPHGWQEPKAFGPLPVAS